MKRFTFNCSRSAEANIAFVLNSVGISDFNSKALCSSFPLNVLLLVLNFLPLQESFRHYTMKFFYGWPFIKVDCADTEFATTISAKTRKF
jgi:hypothetical protein